MRSRKYANAAVFVCPPFSSVTVSIHGVIQQQQQQLLQQQYVACIRAAPAAVPLVAVCLSIDRRSDLRRKMEERAYLTVFFIFRLLFIFYACRFFLSFSTDQLSACAERVRALGIPSLVRG